MDNINTNRIKNTKSICNRLEKLIDDLGGNELANAVVIDVKYLEVFADLTQSLALHQRNLLILEDREKANNA